MRNSFRKYGLYALISVVAVVGLIVGLIFINGFSSHQTNEVAASNSEDNSEQLSDSKIDDAELFFWGKRHDFFGDSFFWKSPMQHRDFIEFIYVLNTLNLDVVKQRKHSGIYEIDFFNLANQEGFIPENFYYQAEKVITSEEAIQLVKQSFELEELNVSEKDISKWLGISYDPTKELNWREAISLLYKMEQYESHSQE